MPPNLSPDQVRALGQLLARGEKVAAIKLYRDHTGSSLADAKEAIENFSPPGASAPKSGPAPDPALIIEALRTRGKIEAIKIYRRQTSLGLREAKLAVEELARQHGIRPRSRGCLGLLGLLALIAAATLAILGSIR